jgi:hypothetical protein
MGTEFKTLEKPIPLARGTGVQGQVFVWRSTVLQGKIPCD